MEVKNETSDLFYMGARTEWLPAEQFMNINNWDDSLKPSASHYIKEVEEWIASKEDKLARNVSLVKQEGEGSTIASREAINLIGEKPYACSQCGKTFAQKRYLTKHLRVHSAEKPLSCSQCGKAFAWRSSLVTHLRTHSGERPFACSQCGKAFAQQGNLAKHIRIHSRAMPTCSQCGQTFTRKAHLTRHVNSGCMISVIDGIIIK